MPQPVAGFEPLRVAGTAAGTTVVLDRNGVLGSVFCGVPTAGTVAFHESKTAAGAAAGNLLFTMDMNQSAGTALDSSTNNHFNWDVNGLTVIVSGTTDFVVSKA